jgi:predicted metal-binding protein/DNA-directed RNA polymerase subunit RPC12/RpoP
VVFKDNCFSEDAFYYLKSLYFSCPVCGEEYTILSDELNNRHHKCHKCGSRIAEVALMRDKRMSELLAFADSLGVASAKLVGVDRIKVEDHFLRQCEEPRCPNYGTSLNCPPHTMTPAQFREHLKQYIHVLIFKFDMPLNAIQGAERREAALLLHETTAAIEHQAKSLGFKKACGYSSGGCKRTFCYEHAYCAGLETGGQCRNPDKARPSLSGMGVNWHELSKTLGWAMQKNEDGESNPEAKFIMMAGLVLLE